MKVGGKGVKERRIKKKKQRDASLKRVNVCFSPESRFPSSGVVLQRAGRLDGLFVRAGGAGRSQLPQQGHRVRFGDLHDAGSRFGA